jgi:hypothetical protein
MFFWSFSFYYVLDKCKVMIYALDIFINLEKFRINREGEKNLQPISLSLVLKNSWCPLKEKLIKIFVPFHSKANIMVLKLGLSQ